MSADFHVHTARRFVVRQYVGISRRRRRRCGDIAVKYLKTEAKTFEIGVGSFVDNATVKQVTQLLTVVACHFGYVRKQTRGGSTFLINFIHREISIA